MATKTDHARTHAREAATITTATLATTLAGSLSKATIDNASTCPIAIGHPIAPTDCGDASASTDVQSGQPSVGHLEPMQDQRVTL